MKKQPKKPTKKEIIKEGFRDWLEETALHGLKYMTTSRSGIVGFLIWVRYIVNKYLYSVEFFT